MLTGDIRNQIDRIWDAFWSGGISNPLEVITPPQSGGLDGCEQPSGLPESSVTL